MCEDFCLLHGYEHMRRRSIFDKCAYCKACEEERTMREGYAVTVSKNGVPILTIESTMLSGAELSVEDVKAIRDAAEHLLGFVGPESNACFACGSEDDHLAECPTRSW